MEDENDEEMLLRGKIPTVLDIEILGAITSNDIAKRNGAVGGLTTVPTIDKIRGIHHQIARMLADGMNPNEVSIITNYCSSRISTLQNDPAFKALVDFYKDKKEEQYTDVHAQLATLGSDAIAEIHSRLENSPDSISTAALIDITKTMLDRAGFSPIQKSVSTNISGSFQDIMKIKKLAKEKEDANAQVTILGELSQDS